MFSDDYFYNFSKEVNYKQLSEVKVGDWVFSMLEKSCFQVNEVNVKYIKENPFDSCRVFISCAPPR